jgi:hypothetical protein
MPADEGGAPAAVSGPGHADAGALEAASTDGASSVETISMVSGNGEVLLSEWPNLDPLVVVVTKGGVPVAGETVAWTAPMDVNIGSGVTTTVTDANGMAQVSVIGGGIMAGLSYIQGQVTASIPAGSVAFWTTTTWDGPSGEAITAGAQLDAPAASRTIGPGKAGSVLKGAVQAEVYAMTGDQSGKGIPYAGVRLTDGMDTTMPAPAGIACVGGTVLTDATGMATCDVMLGSTPGTYAFSVAIGGFREYNELSVTIEP